MRNHKIASSYILEHVARSHEVSKPNRNASHLERQVVALQLHRSHHDLERTKCHMFNLLSTQTYIFNCYHHRLLCFVQDRDVDEGDEQWSLSRFAPLMQEVLEDLAANKLNFDEYPYVQPPSNDSGDSSTFYDSHTYCPSPRGELPGARVDKVMPKLCAFQ